MGHWESNPKRETHSITGISQKARKSSNNQSNFTLKGAFKRTTNTAQSEQKEGIIKIRAEINEINLKKNPKDQ